MDKDTPLRTSLGNLQLKSIDAALEQSPVSIVITDVDANIEYVNPFFTELTGYAREEVIGENPRILKSEVQTLEFYQDMWNTLTSKKAWYGTLCNKKKSGDFYWERASIAPIVNENNVITHYIGVKEDITEERKANQALKHSERFNRKIIDSSQNGIYIYDFEKECNTFINSQYTELTGYSLADSELNNPHQFRRLFHPDDYQKLLDHFESFKQADTDVSKKLEYRFKKRDGTWIWCLSNDTVFERNSQGSVKSILGTFIDFTDRKQTEALRTDAERITRHDLKSQLNSLINLPELMLEDDNLTEEQIEYLRMIRENGYQMLSVLDQSFNLYKMEIGSYTPEVTSVDIKHMLERLLKSFGQGAREKQVELQGFINGSQLSELAAYQIRTDEMLLHSLCSNLISNAIEASPAHETVTVRVTERDQYWYIHVHNKGTIPEHIRPNFFQKYTSAGKKRGTGLGAYTVKLVADTLGGKADFTTSREEGTTITVSLPKL